MAYLPCRVLVGSESYLCLWIKCKVYGNVECTQPASWTKKNIIISWAVTRLNWSGDTDPDMAGWTQRINLFYYF